MLRLDEFNIPKFKNDHEPIMFQSFQNEAAMSSSNCYIVVTTVCISVAVILMLLSVNKH